MPKETSTVEEFAAITTQEDFDRRIGQRLATERAKYADYDELKAKAGKVDELEASKKSDVDKLTEQVETLTKAQATSDANALRAEVAMSKGLKPAQAKRLAGNTREELEADADEILEAFPVTTKEETSSSSRPPSRQPRPDLKGGGEPNEEPVETNPAKLAEGVPRF